MASRARSIRRFVSSSARLIRHFPVSRGESPDGSLGGGSLVPWLFPATDQDASLVSLAGQQDGVAWSSFAYRVGDPLATILDPGVLIALGPADLFGAGRDLAEDGHRVLFPRIFIRENGVIARPGGNLSHPGPFLAITVAGAAEDGDQLASGDRPQLTENFLEALRRVSVIDDHAERLTEVDPLPPATYAAVTLQPLTDFVECQPNCNSRRRRGQRVGGVPAAAQLQAQCQIAKRRRSFHQQALPSRVDAVSLEIRIELKPVGDPPGNRAVDQVRVARVVAIEHRRLVDTFASAAGRQVDQLRLRFAVGFDRLVEVEVLVRDVGEDGYVVVDAHHALQGEPVRPGLDHSKLDPGVTHASQLLLNLERLQGGLARIV